MKYPVLGYAFVALSCLVLAACSGSQLTGSGSTKADSGSRSAPSQIAGVSLPDGYSLTKETLILGEGDRWIGKLSYTINSNINDMFDFVRREMINYGWTEIAVVRGEICQLTYFSSAGDRVASILITAQQIYGSKVDMTVSPTTNAALPNARNPAAPRR
jgi:hypothetical protein